MQQPNLFDAPEGDRRKAAGQALVESHQVEQWKAGVARVIAMLARRAEPFTGDDVRAQALERSLGQPSHPNAWGAAMSTASKRGVIQAVGYTASTQVSRHGAIVRQWRGADA